MRSAALLLWLLLTPAHLIAGLVLTPSQVENGGVAVLRWEGDAADLVVVRYRDQVLYLDPSGGSDLVLLGTDVQQEPGEYPIRAAAVDRRGITTLHHAVLEVRDADRPVERLTLPPEMVSPKKPEVVERILRERGMLRELFDLRSGQRRWRAFRKPVGDPVSSPFGLRRVLNGEPRSPHSGVDFRSPLGTPVAASARGVVALAADLYFTGLTVVLDHGDGLYTLYAHLETFSCTEGDLLERGEVLGTVGSTGRSTGPHLHWGGELRGDRIDPLRLVELLGEEKP